MESLLKSEIFIILLMIISIISFLIVSIVLIKLSKIEKRYEKFISKLGDGKKIEDDLANYMNRVERVEKQNSELVKACDILDENIKICVQKTAIVRYNAFKDTGSELSFALALLDRENNGYVINGVYSRESSNIYAKPVEAGIPKYRASEEEIKAIKLAIKEEKTQ